MIFLIKKRFILKRTELVFSKRQSERIDYLIFSEKYWKNFKGLIDIKLIEMGENYFDVAVVETDTKWHSRLSDMLCKQADLNDLKKAVSNSKDGLFDVINLDS